MKLNIRIDNEYRIIELDTQATNEMWVSLSFGDDEDINQEEKERLIQDAWDEQFNKPEYNNWHKFDRHRGYSKVKPDDGTDELNTYEPLMSEVKDPTIFWKDENDRDYQQDYEAVCQKVRELLNPSQADMVIAIVLDGYTVSEYAELVGDTPNNVSHRYRRAINKLKNFF